MEYALFPDHEVTEGVLRQIDVAGRQILLTRIGGHCHAIDAICPHAGAPLGEGVLHDGTVICPWHKAAFQITTGKRVEPPAVDDLARFPVRTVDGHLRLTIADAASPATLDTSPDPRCMVVIGSGAAGFAAAQILREEGFAGRVLLVGREDQLPYDRTVLSKYALSGKKGGEKSPLQDGPFYQRHRIERVVQPVVRLDASSRTIAFADGSQLRYDKALLATGGMPQPLTVPGHDLAGVHVLRSPDDVKAILASAQGARRAVVVGAGYIGLEAAASLRERGLEVSVVAPQDTPLERQLGRQIGGAFQRVHEKEGVVFHMGQEVASIEGGHRVERVRLKNGTALPADFIVAGLGITPATGFVQGVVRRKDQGVDVDAQLRLADGLYAAGDIAAFPLYGDGETIRVEHWRVAQQQGRIAAFNMLDRNTAFTAVPYFWTIHYLKRLDYVGHAEDWDDITIEGDLDEPNFIAFYMKDKVVRAVAGWGRDRQMASVIPLMEERHDWSLPELKAMLGETSSV